MKLLLLCLFFIPKIVCAQKTSLQIDVKLNGMPDGILFYLNEDNENIDSASSNNQQLKFKYSKITPNPKGLLIISKDKTQGYIVWIEKTSLKLQGTYKDLKPLSTENSQTQIEYNEYVTSTSWLEDSLSLLKRRTRELSFRHDPDSTIYEEKINQLGRLLKQLSIDFFKNHPNSIISTINLSFEAIHHTFTDEELINSFKLLSSDQQNSVEGQGILKAILHYQNPMVGKKAPNFELKDQNDNVVSLSDFVGKKIVLIFWASWCGPCVKEMPDIIKTYQELKNKNLIFIAVSLDEKKDSWLKAISLYSKQIINVSDLKGWMNEAALVYGVSGVPDNFLIDSTGKLIERQRGFKIIKDKIINSHVYQ